MTMTSASSKIPHPAAPHLQVHTPGQSDAESEATKQERYRRIRHGEPMLRVDNIQGNVLPGFNKDFQAFLFLRIVDPDKELTNVRRWLREMIPFIATCEQVLAFNRLYKQVDEREQRAGPSVVGKPKTVQATWMNIAFSHAALSKLMRRAPGLLDQAFIDGLARRSEALGDPQGVGAEGSPRNWVVGGPTNPADIVLIVASDDRDDLLAQIAWLEKTVNPRKGVGGTAGRQVDRALRIVYIQHAAVLPEPNSRNEHFGFRDGISQPGVRGRLPHVGRVGDRRPGRSRRDRQESETPDPTSSFDYLTPSVTDDFSKGKSGQDLVWPGEFVLGYRRQRGAAAREIVEPGPEEPLPGPAWSRDGSYLVIRRLRQDVPTFRSFFDRLAQDLRVKGLEDADASTLQAKSVGRWPSGTPVVPIPADNSSDGVKSDDETTSGSEAHATDVTLVRTARDDPRIANDEARINDFELAELDPSGTACPFAAHIRKVYTRDDTSTSLGDLDGELREPLTSELTTQTHRLLRRGIPFGEPYDPDRAAKPGESDDRGLMFVAYQASIVRQFEFLITALVNNPAFRVANEGVPAADYDPGYDLIIGQNGRAADRARKLMVYLGAERVAVETTDEWVVATGGGYFFAPSIHALESDIVGQEVRERSSVTSKAWGTVASVSVGTGRQRAVESSAEEGAMAAHPEWLRDATDDQLVVELAGRIKRYYHEEKQGIKDRLNEQRARIKAEHYRIKEELIRALSQGDPARRQELTQVPVSLPPRPDLIDKEDDHGEELIEKLLDLTEVPKFIGYWKLGDFIYEQNPYFDEDEIEFEFSEKKVKPGIAGILKSHEATWVFKDDNPGANIPKAKDAKPGQIQAWYYRKGRYAGEVPKSDETDELNKVFERNVVKELEIEYGPLLEERDEFGNPQPKAPHLIVLYCGGDH
jgi:Dyp-type peroxidase family